MKENIQKLIKLGKIPPNSEMTDEQFRKYDNLLAGLDECLTWEEAEGILTLFSDDCDDLNWVLLHAIETVDYNDIDKYSRLIEKCNNENFKEILKVRLNNWLEKR